LDVRSTLGGSAVHASTVLPVAFVAALVACGSPPSSQEEVLAMAPAPPLEIAEHFSAQAHGDLRPLEPSEYQLVQVSVDAAIARSWPIHPTSEARATLPSFGEKEGVSF
jgi:hypothetical protein